MALTKFRIIILIFGLLFISNVSFSPYVNAEDVRYSHDKALLSEFNNVLVAIAADDLDLAEHEILELQERSKSLGYAQLSEFSFRLIRSAKSYNGTSVDGRRILLMAEGLAPSHPGVLLSISSFTDSISSWEQVIYFKKALVNIIAYPLTGVSILSRLLVSISLGAIVSCFLVMLIILMSSWVELQNQGARLFSRKYKRLGGSILFFAAIVLPGLLPLLLAMLVWSLILAIALPRFWWITLVAALSATYVEFLIEPSVLLNNFAESPSSRALEAIANNGFSPRLLDYVDDEVSKESSSPVWQVILGQLFQSRGDTERAMDYYEKARLNLEKEKSITYLISFNKAVSDLEHGENEKAFKALEELRLAGWNEFEVLYNISLASTLLHRVDVYERTFKILQEKFPKQLNQVLQAQGERPRPILASLPNKFFIEILRFELRRIWSFKSSNVTLGSYIKLGSCGFAFLFSIFCRLRKKSQRYSRTFASRRLFQLARRNRFWLFMPLGWAIREGRMLSVFLYVNCWVVLTILITALPIKVFMESQNGLRFLLPILILTVVLSFKPFRREVLDAN